MSDMAHGTTPLRATPAPGAAAAYRAPNGWIIFAAVTLFMSGGLSILFGIAALLNDKVVRVGGDGVTVLDFTTWGWVAIISGVVMMLTGVGLGLGLGIARWLAIGLVVIHAALQFGFVSAFPILAILIIALDVAILYQLAVHWDG